MPQQQKTLALWAALPISVFAWISAIFFSVFYFLVGLFFGFLPSLVLHGGTRRIMHWIAETWARCIMAVSPVWKFKADGLEKFDAARPYVIVANHQSLLDILLVLAALKTHFKFIAKKELFFIPCFGWHMALSGYIALDRGNPESAKKVMMKATDFVRRGVSVLFFPEGTRSLDGEIKKFKAGAFRIAQQTGAQILPVVLDGTGEAIPKHTLILKRKTRFHLSVLEPFPIEGNSPEAVNQAIEKCGGRMIAHLAEIRKAKGE